MFNIPKAKRIAKRAHRGMKDKAGRPYILHPMAVAAMVKGRDAKVVALLHDVNKHEMLDLDKVRKQFGINVSTALSYLTRLPGEDYFRYIANIRNNEIARQVKIADLKQNISLIHFSVISTYDLWRVGKYLRALEVLL